MAQIVIREILAVTWLRRLWREMGDDLVVHPYHADQAGGLGAIGHHAVMLSILVLMVMLFIIMGSLLPSLRGSGPITLRIWSPLIILLWLIYFTLVPAIFASLIWPAHRRMQEAAEEQINLVSGQLDDRLTAAQSQAASDHGQLPATMGIIGEMKKLHVLLGEDFPTWPLSAAARRRLPLTSLIPLAYSILTAVLDLIARLRS
jgi:membrane protein implicated in regulation of membrane protease activity